MFHPDDVITEWPRYQFLTFHLIFEQNWNPEKTQNAEMINTFPRHFIRSTCRVYTYLFESMSVRQKTKR